MLEQLQKIDDLQLHILGDKKTIEEELGKDTEIIEFAYPVYSTQEQVGFLHLKKIVGNNILHIPHYNIPILCKFNLVVTIHDLIHLIYPKGASKRFASVYMRLMIERALSRAKRVISVSHTTRDYLEKIYGLKNTNIEVVYEGADEKFCKINDTTYLRAIKEKYKLPDRFILYVGSIRRHKNIGTLIKSFTALSKKISDIWLVMVGKLANKFDLKKERVLYLGEVAADRDLVGIYNLASCFCNLSLFEGFGLTILEAQAVGIPVVCSGIPAHLEIGGGGVSIVSPHNLDQICTTLYNVLTNSDLRESLIDKGRNNVKRFDCKKSAQRTFEIYKEVSGEQSV